MTTPSPATRVAVFGLPGTGKTTLAHQLAAAWKLPVHELDDVLFTPTGALPLPEFRSQVSALTDTPTWIVEGKYSKLQDITWDRAGIVIWLDYRLPLILFRVTRRNLSRLSGRDQTTSKPLTWRDAFFGRRSIFANALRKYLRNRPKYERQIAETAVGGVRVLRFRTPRQTGHWLQNAVTSPPPTPRTQNVPTGPERHEAGRRGPNGG
jgi:adenylate kinase family enzyme